MKEASGARAKRDAYDDFLDGIEWLNAPASADGSAGKAAKKRASASGTGKAKIGAGEAAKAAAVKKDSAKAASGGRKSAKADAAGPGKAKSGAGEAAKAAAVKKDSAKAASGGRTSTKASTAGTGKTKSSGGKAAKAAPEKSQSGEKRAADKPMKPGEGTEKPAKPKSAAKPAAARKKAAPKAGTQPEGDLLSAWAELSGERGERRSLVASRPAANSASRRGAAGKKASSSRASDERRPAQGSAGKPVEALLTMPFDEDAPQRSGRRAASSSGVSGVGRPAQGSAGKPAEALLTMPFDEDAPRRSGRRAASSSCVSGVGRPAQRSAGKPAEALLTMPFDEDAPQRSSRRALASSRVPGAQKKAAGRGDALPEKQDGEAGSKAAPGEKSAGQTAAAQPRKDAQRAPESGGRSGGAASRQKSSSQPSKKGGGNRSSRARRGGELFFAVDGRDPFDDYLDATGPQPPRGGRRTSGLTAFLAVCIAAILGLAGWQAVRYQDFLTMKSAVAEQGFYDGTTVEGIDVSDMTLESALAYWEAEVEPAYAQRTVSLDSGATLTAAQLGYSSDYAAVLARAWNAGQTGSLEERYARIAERQAQPASYSVTRTLYTDSAIESFAESMAAQIDRPAQDAALESFDVDSFQFTYVEEVAGSRLDTQALARDIAQALDAGGGSVALSVESIQPEVTVASLSSQYGMIAYAVTNASSSSSNRLTNIALSLELINGTRLDPGETFSFNETVGERTTDRGFKVATAYSSGEVTEEVGGGICQVSTTLFNAAVKSDMEIVERHNHSLTVSYVDLGKDAAVDWGNKDLRFTNTGDEPVYIVCLLTDDKRVRIGFFGKLLPNGESITVEGETTGTIGYETVYQPNLSFPSGYSEVTQRGRNGYTAVAYKIRWDAEGNQISSELLCSSTYRTTNEIIEYGP